MSVADGTCYLWAVRLVGKRRTTLDAAELTPAEALPRATELQRQTERLNPYPRPRGFVFREQTWVEYAR